MDHLRFPKPFDQTNGQPSIQIPPIQVLEIYNRSQNPPKTQVDQWVREWFEWKAKDSGWASITWLQSNPEVSAKNDCLLSVVTKTDDYTTRITELSTDGDPVSLLEYQQALGMVSKVLRQALPECKLTLLEEPNQVGKVVLSTPAGKPLLIVQKFESIEAQHA
jgi:hypothetical protein